MRYRILGPVEVRDGPRVIALPPGRQPIVLAVLLVHANEVVGRDRLIDALWGESPPSTALHSLHNVVSALRKGLGDALATRDGGYVLQVAAGELDADVFEALAQEASVARGRGEIERAAELLREALGLWRGPALGGLAYHIALADEAARLDEARLTALEERVDAELAYGRHADVVAELEGLVAQHPLRERLRAHHMLALYRCGRQADALASYRDARRHLNDELGIEPGRRCGGSSRPCSRRTRSRVLRTRCPTRRVPSPGPAATPAR
jgi:DNA-binding SARP family transcriptional activator